MSNERIHIKSDISCEFSSKITDNDVTYIVHTEEKGKDSSQACSRVYLGGKVLFSKVADFSHLIGSDDFQDKLENFMTQLHKFVVDQFTATLKKIKKKKSEYLKEARDLLRKGKSEEAFGLLEEGLKVFPADPFLLSYYGSLYSQVARKPSEGVRICRDAISKLEGRASVNREFLYPAFYLNLGMAYQGANKKREAICAFKVGLKSDPTNRAIIAEMNKLGRRKKPVLHSLKRSNPLNKYLGLFLSRTGISRR